jgi:uncharacterized protein (UPF0335 family)
LKPAPRDAPLVGTFRWLCIEHFKSVAFKQLDPRTQHVTRLVVEKMFREPIAPGAKELFGNCPLPKFDAKAVRILRDRRADRREAANNRVRRLRRIFAWALENGLEGVKANPARDVPLLKPGTRGRLPGVDRGRHRDLREAASDRNQAAAGAGVALLHGRASL